MFRRMALACVLLGVLACGGDPTQPDPDPDPNPGPELAAYLATLPAWSTFSPAQPNSAPNPTGDSTALPDERILNVPDYSDPADTTAVTAAITYACYSTPYTMTDNPEQIVMYSPDKDVLWPGALIQGKSHRDPLGQLLPLPIVERSPMQISIPGLATGDNFRTVDQPTQATVTSAIGDMIGNATASGLATPSTIVFKQETYYSEEQFALSINVSGKYLGFSSSASGSFSSNASETTVTAHFLQKMYEVVFSAPATPAAFFSNAFTQAKLQEQVNLDRIGPDNPPVYVSKIVYGRMMAFSFTSSASEIEIRATLQAAYDGLTASGSVSLSTTQRRILREAKITVSSLGGDAQATLDVIRSGDWSQYFTDNAPLSTAEPLSYEFKTLTGELAGVTESTSFTIKNCGPQPPGGTFEFLTRQELPMGVQPGFQTHVADVNGDGWTDLVANYLAPTMNEVAVALSNGDGTFSVQALATHPATPSEGWPNYDLLVGDVNNDGMDDLLWNHLGTANNTYVALSTGGGSFTFTPVRTHPAQGWTTYVARMGDIDGANGDDIVWSQPINGSKTTYVGVSDGNGDFTFPAGVTVNTHHCGKVVTEVADMNGDPYGDLVQNSINDLGPCIGFTNNTHIGYGAQDASVSWTTVWQNTGNWVLYEPALIGNVDGEGRADLVFTSPNSSVHRTYVFINNGTGVMTQLPLQDVPAASLVNETDPLAALLIDVDGNGIKDLVWHTTNANNWLIAGLGTNSGVFDFSRPNQTHPVPGPPTGADWATYRTLAGDINGDGREDILWINEAIPNNVYVGLANAK